MGRASLCWCLTGAWCGGHSVVAVRCGSAVPIPMMLIVCMGQGAWRVRGGCGVGAACRAPHGQGSRVTPSTQPADIRAVLGAVASLSRSGVQQCGSPLASRFLPLALVGPRRHEHGTQQEQRPPPRHAANGGARYEETREVTPERDEAREEVQCMRAHYREANLPRQSVVLSVGITGRE